MGDDLLHPQGFPGDGPRYGRGLPVTALNDSTAEAVLSPILPAGRFGDAGDRACFTVDNVTPATVVFPESISELQAALRAAVAGNLALLPAGCGAHLGIGMPPASVDCALSTARLARVVEHAAADMTVTVEAGLTLAQLDAALSASGQWLPVDPPLPHTTTIGGLIAANLSGPLRLSQGSVSHLLLGIRVVLVDGTLIASGGRVVKNVAGYQLQRAFIGSFGTLGVIVEATFKVRPRPETVAVVLIGYDSPDPAMQLVHAVRNEPLEPLWITMTNDGVIPGVRARRRAGPHAGVLVAIGLGGVAASVAAQRERIAELAEARPDVRATYETVHAALRDFPATVDADAVCTVNLLPTDVAGFVSALAEEIARRRMDLRFVADAAVARLHLALTAPGGGDDNPATLAGMISQLRGLAVGKGGHLVIQRASPQVKRAAGVWGDSGQASFLMERLKRAFDANHLLSKGRFVGGI